jgi:ribosome-associated protein
MVVGATARRPTRPEPRASESPRTVRCQGRVAGATAPALPEVLTAERFSVPTTFRDLRDAPRPEGGLLKTAVRRLAPPAARADALDRACLCARVAADNKGRDIVVLDMRGVTPIYDFLVLVTGGSRRQIHTIAEETDAALRDVGDTRLGIEGYEASRWVVQDYGDVVVHVFDQEAREYYALEDLWADAAQVDWERVA